jgi:hypothetical protein
MPKNGLPWFGKSAKRTSEEQLIIGWSVRIDVPGARRSVTPAGESDKGARAKGANRVITDGTLGVEICPQPFERPGDGALGDTGMTGQYGSYRWFVATEQLAPGRIMSRPRRVDELSVAGEERGDSHMQGMVSVAVMCRLA